MGGDEVRLQRGDLGDASHKLRIVAQHMLRQALADTLLQNKPFCDCCLNVKCTMQSQLGPATCKVSNTCAK